MKALRALSAIHALLAAGAVCAQDFPLKPLRIITSEVGGGSDFTARLIAQGLSGNLGQQAIVDNRPAGVAQGEAVAKAPPDGYTLFVTGDTLWTLPLLQKTPYDPVKDFAPITLMARAPTLLVVHPSLPVKSVQELVTLAKARPGALNYSSGATGSSSHLSAELFKSMAAVNIVRIPYKGGGPAIIDLIGGQVQLTFGSASAITPHIKSGKLKALAVTTAQPSALFPGLPAVAASVPGYESVAVHAVFTSAKTPDAIIRRLNQEIVRVLNQADVKNRLFNTGIETVGGTPEELAATINSGMTKLAKVIKDAGIRAD
jgi:tripartite-type tricarboxylate transporter receptor subunit TctC